MKSKSNDGSSEAETKRGKKIREERGRMIRENTKERWGEEKRMKVTGKGEQQSG